MDEMKFAVALTLLFFGPFVDAEDDALTACMDLMKPKYADEMCCENLRSIDKFDDEVKECSNGSSEELVCANFECFLKKQEMLDKGKVVDEKAKKFFDGIAKEYPKDKNVIERVKEECLDSKYEEYPPEDEDCPALQFYVCVYTNIMVECESWKDTKVCKEASVLADKCKEAK